MIVIISPESMASGNVEDEWQYFLDQNKPVIPVVFREARIHFQLNRLQRVDFLHQPFEDAFEQLRSEIQSNTVGSLWPPGNLARRSRRKARWVALGGLTLLVLISTGIGLLVYRQSPLNMPEATVQEISIASPTVPGSANVARNIDWTPSADRFGIFEMVLVPAGCFQMGSSDGADDEKPPHPQCFDSPFWIDKVEVTNGQFVQLSGNAEETGSWTAPNRPRESISWFEARDFCITRGARLPTEREWEYAARGPDSLIYPWGNHWNPNNAAWSGNSNRQTADVGSFPGGVSWVGALDMSGNVWEWTSTVYGIDNGDHNFSALGEFRFPYPYDANDGRQQDSNEVTVVRVLGGGSWRNNPVDLRSSFRGRSNPDLAFNYGGFRCARS
jgi:formylglycine-generating enzyme required for sulfatase activity